jgi:hypothetical protein
MSIERWGDSRADRDALDRHLTREPDYGAGPWGDFNRRLAANREPMSAVVPGEGILYVCDVCRHPLDDEGDCPACEGFDDS